MSSRTIRFLSHWTSTCHETAVWERDFRFESWVELLFLLLERKNDCWARWMWSKEEEERFAIDCDAMERLVKESFACDTCRSPSRLAKMETSRRRIVPLDCFPSVFRSVHRFQSRPRQTTRSSDLNARSTEISLGGKFPLATACVTICTSRLGLTSFSSSLLMIADSCWQTARDRSAHFPIGSVRLVCRPRASWKAMRYEMFDSLNLAFTVVTKVVTIWFVPAIISFLSSALLCLNCKHCVSDEKMTFRGRRVSLVAGDLPLRDSSRWLACWSVVCLFADISIHGH